VYNGKTILGLIPARGGSKGLPRKNIIPLLGKPLIAWTIEEAKKSKYIDRLILSSEDDEIIRIAKEYGCEVPFKRPVELAQDNTPGIEPVLDAIKKLPNYDYVILLQPTSPLRTVEDIDGCVEKCIYNKVNACVSVTEPDKSPYWMYSLDDKDKMVPLLDTEEEFTYRQEIPKAYVLNGAIYVAKANYLLKKKSFVSEDTIAFIMPPERSIDIDSEVDFKLAEILIKNNIPKLAKD
jgi:N-acylneuraminate cytidylyltransferase